MIEKPEFMLGPNPRLGQNPWKVLTEEIGPWQDYNFPGWRDYPYRLLLGITEELGELSEALDDDYGLYSPASVRDAIGDLVVFSAAYCESLGLSLLDYMSGEPEPAPIRRVVAPEKHLTKLIGQVGRLAHARLKTEQGIRGSASEHLARTMTAIEALMRALQRLVRDLPRLQADLGEIVAETWGSVRLRDWRAHKRDGQGD